MPLVSVVIPTRDRRAYLEAALATALAQEVELEVVVVDDGSRERLPPFDDARIRCVRSERPQGAAIARNRGIAAARGRWIAFLDDDDLWAPDKLVRQLNALDAQAGWSYGGAVVFGDDRHGVVADVPPPPAPDVLSSLFGQNTIPAGCSNVVVRADLLGDGFDASLPRLEDWDLWLRLAEFATPAVITAPLVGYRRHTTNMLFDEQVDMRASFARFRAKHKTLADRVGCQFDEHAFAHWVAAGQRRSGRRLAAALTHLLAAIDLHDMRHLVAGVRAPLGDWAMELRQRPAEPVDPPPWLMEALGWR